MVGDHDGDGGVVVVFARVCLADVAVRRREGCDWVRGKVKPSRAITHGDCSAGARVQRIAGPGLRVECEVASHNDADRAVLRGGRVSRILRGRIVRYGSAVLALIFLVLIVLSLPYYAGSTIHASLGSENAAASGAWRLSWRLEHARLTVTCRPDFVPGVQLHEPLWIAHNSEGLRWMPGGHFARAVDWHVTLPLWMALVLCAGVSVLGWRSWRQARRRAATHCHACG